MSLRRTLASLALATTLSSSAALAADFKVGVVDVEAVVAQTDEGKAASSRLEKWAEQQKKDLQKEEESLVKERDVLAKQASTMKEETLAQKQGEFQKRYMDYMQKAQKLQQELVKKQQTELQPILGRIDQVVSGIAERDGLSMVLEKRGAGIAFMQKSLDYTDEVVRQYNTAAKKQAAAPKK
jgi:outer membrane protein